MPPFKVTNIFIFCLLLISCRSAKLHNVEFDDAIDTSSRPIHLQEKRSWTFGKIHFRNDFDGARVNSIHAENDSSFVVSIMPENEPINPSPWYGFKIWSENLTTAYIRLDYNGKKHRYNPKFLKNNASVDSSRFKVINKDDKNFTFSLELFRDTITVSAQKIESSKAVNLWMKNLSDKHHLVFSQYGTSTYGAPLYCLEMDDRKANKPTVVVLSRQHPPEVTGYFAMQSFINTILEMGNLQKSFLSKYRILVFPLLNPDGVDLGHWRHNVNGIDLNRDWGEYRQKEIKETVQFIVEKCSKRDNRVVLALDFHSTFEDVFYVNEEDDNIVSFPGFKEKWINNLRASMPNQKFEVKPSAPKTPVSKNWFYRYFNAVGITYEIGDDTSEEIIRLKGQNSALEMMKLLVSY